MKILLIGAGGQLGSDLQKTLRAETLTPLSHGDLDITDAASIRRVIAERRPEVVINTAAFHRVDDCETQVERAFRVNAFAVRDLALACRQFDSTLVHFSTDYVFDGVKNEPYGEADLPRPLNVYGASKLAGEFLLRAALDRYFLIRTCGLYGIGGSRSKGGNFVETMLRLAAREEPIRVVDDQVVTPTSTADLAWKVGQLIHTEAYGLYHITNKGRCSWYEFARTILELAGVGGDLQAISSAAFGAAAARPPFSVLRNLRLETLGLDDLPAWDDALRRYMTAPREQVFPG